MSDWPENVIIIELKDNKGKLFERYFTTEHPYEIEKVLNKEICTYFNEDELNQALEDKKEVMNTPLMKTTPIPKKIDPKTIKVPAKK